MSALKQVNYPPGLPMPEKKQPRGTHPIQVDTEIVSQIKTIVAHTGQSISDYVSPILKDQVFRDYERVTAEQNRKIEEARKKKK